MYTRNLLNVRLKLVFKYKITFWICVLAVWIHKGYCVVKKMVWNVRIKAFCYTKTNVLSKKEFSNVVLVLSNIGLLSIVPCKVITISINMLCFNFSSLLFSCSSYNFQLFFLCLDAIAIRFCLCFALALGASKSNNYFCRSS